MSKTVLFQTIQFSISAHFYSIWLKDRTLSGATNPDQSGPGSDGNKGGLLIPQSSSINEASPSDCFVSYPGHLLGESYLFAEKQSVYSAAPVDWASVADVFIYLTNASVRAGYVKSSILSRV